MNGTDRQATARSSSAPRPSRRSLAIGALGGVVLLAAGTAYVLGTGVIDGDPVPRAVKDEVQRVNRVRGELIPSVREGPRVLAEETRAAAVLQASTGPVYLWVAPTESGDRCLFLQVVGTEGPDGRPNLGGGCGRGAPGLEASLSGTRVRDGRWLVLVHGRVERPVERVEIRVEDGPRIVPPLSDGFFLVEVPGVADSEVPSLEIVGRAADGRVVSRRKQGRQPNLQEHPVGIAGESPVLEILTRRTRKPIKLYVVERGGERCSVLETPGGTASGCGGGSPPGPREIPIRPNQIGSAPKGMLLLWGEVGRGIATLELRFEDGRVEKLPLARHFTLYQVDPSDFALGRRPVELIGRGTEGRVVGRQTLGPWRS
jgi:hypothetical protein